MYRSKFEETVAQYLSDNNYSFNYETKKIKWVDYRRRTYTPDFILANGIIIETKGRFVSEDRRKHLEIKKQYPNLDIRFLFYNCRCKLYKGAKSTYANWCDKNDFKYAEKVIPNEWFKE